MKKAPKKKPSVIDQRQEKVKALLLEHLQKMPVVQVACAKTGISRATYYRWLKRDKEFEWAVEDAKEQGVDMVNDMAESVVIKRIQENDIGASKYWLSHHSPTYDSKRKQIEKLDQYPVIHIER